VPNGVRLCAACLSVPLPFEHPLAAVDCDHPWDGLNTNFKFHAALDLEHAPAQRLRATFECGDTPAPTLLLPVPLSAERLRERSYDQAWELARRIGRVLLCEGPMRACSWASRTRRISSPCPKNNALATSRAAFAVEPRRLAEVRSRSVPWSTT
jgi:predicted amidophosphoribosyltransferase